MDISIFYGLGGGVVGLLVGWLVSSVAHQRRQARHETELRLLEQTAQQTRQLLSESQQSNKQYEQRQRDHELMLRDLHAQPAAGQESCSNWRNCVRSAFN